MMRQQNNNGYLREEEEPFVAPQNTNAMTELVQIGQVMTTSVVTVSPDDTMERVHHIFQGVGIHHLPVVNAEGRVLGIISKSDYLTVANAFPLFRKDLRDAANERLFATLLVEEIMTKQVATLHPEDSILLAAGYFRENLFHAIPIVDRQHKLVGIVTPLDLLNFFFNQPALLTN